MCRKCTGIRNLATDLQKGMEKRYELKAVYRLIDYERLRLKLLSGRVPIRTQHPSRTVQSIYMDTDTGRAIRDNLAGISERFKYRFRWYGPESMQIKGCIEKKIRSGGIGSKERCPVELPVTARGMRQEQFMRLLFDASHNAQAFSDFVGLMPVQWIRYRRDYFAVDGGAIRITLDTNLEAFDCRYSPVVMDRFATPLPALSILEIKTSETHLEAASRILNALPVQISNCSKFMIASLPGSAPTPSRLEN